MSWGRLAVVPVPWTVVRRALVLIPVLLAVFAATAAAGRCGDRTCRADVSVSGHAEPQPIREGETSEYKITPMNNGEDGALAIDVQVDIPDGLEIVSVTHFGGNSCSVQGQFVRCDLGDFASQQQAVVRIKVRGPREGTYIANARVYSSDVDDPNGGNNQVSMTLLVQKREDGGSGGGGGSGDGGSGGDGSGEGTANRISVRVAGAQRLLRTGGVNLTVRTRRSGRIAVRGHVLAGSRRVKLSSVTRRVRAGRTTRVFLGTSRSARSSIRAALRRRSRLPAVVTVRSGRVTTRLNLEIRR